MATAIGVGPVLAGFVFDRTQSYDLVLMAGIPSAIVSAVLLFSLGRYPEWE